MAAHLRGIVNGSYKPYGSGRDFFFIGDFEYKNGRRTPDMNIRWSEEQKGMVAPAKRKGKGPPQEMVMTKSINGAWGASSASSSNKNYKSMSPRIAERLRRQQSEPTCNDAIQSRSTKYANTVRWRESNTTRRDVKAGTRLRSANPKDTSIPPPGPATATSSELGQVHLLGHSYSFSEYGAPEKFCYHSALHRSGPPPPKEEVDEHMREFPGKQKHPSMQANKFYQNALAETETPLDKPLSKTTSLEWGHPMKHHNHSGKCFPPKDVNRVQPEREPGWRPPEWGMPDKHRFHQPPLYAPKQDKMGLSRIPPGKECEIPASGAPPARRFTPPGCRVY